MGMDTFYSVVATAASVFLVTALGAYLRKIGRLSEQADKSMMWLAINILYPALIVNSILKNPALDVLENIFLPPIMGFGSVMISLGLGFLFLRFAKLRSQSEEKSFLVSNALNNYGFLPIPLILALYNRETLGVLFVHNIGVDIAIWSVCILILSRHDTLLQRMKNLVNAPLTAIAISIFLTYFDLDEHVPSVVFKTTALLGQAAIPVALMLVGSLMYEAKNSTAFSDGWWLITSSLAIRVVLFPICYLALVWAIPMTLELKQVMIVEAAQPAAMLPIVLCKKYDASPQVAFIVLLVTSLASLLTMPFWIYVGTRIL
jgi:predicted permease